MTDNKDKLIKCLEETLVDFQRFERFITGSIYPYVEQDFMSRKTRQTIQAALTTLIEHYKGVEDESKKMCVLRTSCTITG